MKIENTPENTGKKQIGKFVKGQSGNPNGRPKGALNSTTKAAMELLDGEAEAITRKAITLALSGDMQAIKLVLERTIPARKERAITLDLSDICAAKDVMHASKKIINAVSIGELTPSEGNAVMVLLENIRKAIETMEFEQRINHLEVHHAKS